MSLSPAAILVKALEDYDDLDITRLANRAGVSPNNAKRAARGSKGRRPGVNDYLRLCAVIGIDPLNGRRCDPWKPVDLDAYMLAIAVRMRRLELGHGMRCAVADMDISIFQLPF